MGFRGQGFALDSPAAAVEAMVARVKRLSGGHGRPVEHAGLGGLRGRILAERVTTDLDSPAFDYSAMDGYAVRAGDLAHLSGAALKVVGEARIGCEPPVLPAGACAVRIVTGAGIPAGADAVIKREDVVERAGEGGGQVDCIVVSEKAARAVRGGENIRRRGENAVAGTEVACAGTVLSASTLGALAAAGCGDTKVYAKLRVGLITTGDELVPCSVKPRPFEVRNSNQVVLWTALESHPWLSVDAIAHNGDEVGPLIDRLRKMLEKVDAVVLSGGVSMGHRDPVREAVEAVGGEVVFHGLPQRPGKPMLGAVVKREGRTAAAVFGLPGNPVSSMVTCVRIVAPVLAACAGATCRARVPRVKLAVDDGKVLDLWWHRLVRINERGEAELVDGRGSGDIIAGGRSDGFVEVPPPSAGPIPTLLDYYPWPV